MSSNSTPDMALNALLMTAREVSTGLPENLILQAYAIQRRHQFDREGERDASLQETQRLVEEYVASVSLDRAGDKT
jgi:hypothetical protein